MERVTVIGCSGAGKSVFSKKLHQKTGLPLYHLDMLFWREEGTHLEPAEFNPALQRVVDTPAWIIDGNYSRTLPMRLERCDTIFFLDIPYELCLNGVLSRRGKKRDDLPWIEPVELDEDFAEFIRSFESEKRPAILEMLESYPDKEIHIFRSREEADTYLNNL